MWINQPSTSQRFHKYHGMNVLALPYKGFVTVYFISGDVISMIVPSNILSDGWKA